MFEIAKLSGRIIECTAQSVGVARPPLPLAGEGSGVRVIGAAMPNGLPVLRQRYHPHPNPLPLAGEGTCRVCESAAHKSSPSVCDDLAHAGLMGDETQ
jgi:hypothetical protein